MQTARENNGYTQEAFAETLNISVEHYRKIESGICGLQPEKMLVLYKTKYPKIKDLLSLTENVTEELKAADQMEWNPQPGGENCIE